MFLKIEMGLSNLKLLKNIKKIYPNSILEVEIKLGYDKSYFQIFNGGQKVIYTTNAIGKV